MTRMLPPWFKGKAYFLPDNWYEIVPKIPEKPIKYLEIGTFYGANLFAFAESYGVHPETELHCIDPWIDYNEYNEYKDEQEKVYETFLENLSHCPHKRKITIHRGYSQKIVPQFQDEYFDLIYIDGNHEPEYVLEDAVLCFRKLLRGGVMIFDDYGWGGPDMTQRGITAFLSAYHKRIKIIGFKNNQVFVQKI